MSTPMQRPAARGDNPGGAGSQASGATHVIVGRYAKVTGEEPEGGLSLMALDDSGHLLSIGEFGDGLEAGYLAAAPGKSRVYAVDERKNDGRGPVGPAASVRSFAFADGGDTLVQDGSQPALGPFPTYLSVHPNGTWLAVASHGSFDHVEHVVRTSDGWAVENLYDDSTVSLYALDSDGRIGQLADLVVLTGHGVDPSDSAQAGGHPQASAHAHCAQFDPGGDFVLVCDKGTDTIHVFRVHTESGTLETAHVHRCAPGTAPRHVAFHPNAPLLFVTNELASTLTSYHLDQATGSLRELHTISTLAPGGCERTNEPAEVQAHPGGHHVFVNNRGQDTLVGFHVDPASGVMAYACTTPAAPSIHPGVAARSFRFDPTGSYLFFADRPADAVVTYAVDPDTGSLSETSRTRASQPAFVLVI